MNNLDREVVRDYFKRLDYEEFVTYFLRHVKLDMTLV